MHRQVGAIEGIRYTSRSFRSELPFAASSNAPTHVLSALDIEKIFPLHPLELAAPIGVVRLRRRLLPSTTVRITVYQYD